MNKFNEQVGGEGANPENVKMGKSKCACTTSSSQLNNAEECCVPVGSIIMWNGSYTGPITQGQATYHICDGTGGTPNLTDLFIVGASAPQPEGTSGGNSSVNYIAGANNMPTHTHFGFDNGQANGVSATPYPGTSGGATPPNYPTAAQMSRGAIYMNVPTSFQNFDCVAYGLTGSSAPPQLQPYASEATTGGCTAATGTPTGGTAAAMNFPTIPEYYALYYLMRVS
tara:strand:+ start:121 stop:798 length:678 start_codon:yes stop_codon:yes gene_type:complete